MVFLEIKRKSRILYVIFTFFVFFSLASFSYASSDYAHDTVVSDSFVKADYFKTLNSVYKDYFININKLCEFYSPLEKKYYYFFVEDNTAFSYEYDDVVKKYKVVFLPVMSDNSSLTKYNAFVLSKTSSALSLSVFYVPSPLEPTGRVFVFDGDGVDVQKIHDSSTYDQGKETVRFDVPTQGQLVKESNQVISLALSHLKFKSQFLQIGSTDWKDKIQKSGYSLKFFVNDEEVDLSSARYFKVQSVNTVMCSLYYSSFLNDKEYKLKVELFKEDKLISSNTIYVTCKSTFVDVNGDGIDDNTGLKIPNLNPISIFDDFGKFISSLFSSFFSVFSSALIALKDFVSSVGSFFETVASVFTADQTLRNMILLSFSATVFLRIMGR